jgi:hypothetical protein
MPGYGLAPASGGDGLLPWSWAQERLARSHNYWISTVSPGSRAHAAPVWGVWLDDVFYFSTAPGSRKERNLRADPRCVVTTESAEEAVIAEGDAAPSTDAAALAAFKKAYDEKYAWDIETEGIIAVTPRVVFGFIEHAGRFQKTATKWAF